jgi:hypothetical protein
MRKSSACRPSRVGLSPMGASGRRASFTQQPRRVAVASAQAAPASPSDDQPPSLSDADRRALRHQRSDMRAPVVWAGRTNAAAAPRPRRRRERRFAPHQLRHAHAVEMAREGVPPERHPAQLGHADLGVRSVYLQRIDNTKVISVRGFKTSVHAAARYSWVSPLSGSRPSTVSGTACSHVSLLSGGTSASARCGRAAWFDVLGELTAPASDGQPRHRRVREIGERKEHLPMPREPTTTRFQSWTAGGGPALRPLLQNANPAPRGKLGTRRSYAHDAGRRGTSCASAR